MQTTTFICLSGGYDMQLLRLMTRLKFIPRLVGSSANEGAQAHEMPTILAGTYGAVDGAKVVVLKSNM